MPPRPRNSHLLEQLQLGDEIDVWWPHDAQYYPGVVGSLLPSRRHRILYNDGEVEDLALATEQWRFTGLAARRVLATQSLPDSALSESTSTGKTPATKNRVKYKSRKSDSSKPLTQKLTRTKNSSSTQPQNLTDNPNNMSPSNNPPPVSRALTTKLKKRQRSSTSTIALQTHKTINPHSPDLDSGLIDAAPLPPTTTNNTVSPLPSILTSIPSPATLPVNSAPKISGLQTNLSVNHLTPSQTAIPTPIPTVTKPAPRRLSASVLGTTHTTVASLNGPNTSTSASAATKNTHQRNQGKSPSPALATHVITSQGKESMLPRTQQQFPKKHQKPGEKDNLVTNTIAKSVAPKKGGTITPILDKRGGSHSDKPKPVRSTDSQPLPVQPTSIQKPTSSNTLNETISQIANGHRAPNHASEKAPMPLSSGQKHLHQISDNSNNQSNRKQHTKGNHPTQTNLPLDSTHNCATGNDPVQQNSLKLQPKGNPQSVPSRCAETSPAPNTIANATEPHVALMTRVVNDTEHKRLVSHAKETSSSPRLNDSLSGPLPSNLKGTSSPRKSVDGFKRASRPNTDAKSSSRSNKGTNLAKLSAVKKSISKPARTALQKHAIQTLSPRLPSEPNGRRTVVNPDDGSDIIADVHVPRKPRSGPASPTLRSPLDRLRPSSSSPKIGDSRSDGMGPKSTNGVDLKDISLQQALPAGTSARDNRSPMVKWERSGNKPGPFQPTKRRSGTHRPGAIPQIEQHTLTDALPKKMQSTNLRQRGAKDREPTLPSSPKSSRLELPTVSVLSRSNSIGSNQAIGIPKQSLSIPDPELKVSGRRRPPSTQKNKGNNSTPPTKPISASLEQVKDLIKSPEVNKKESMDGSKPSGVAIRDLLVSAGEHLSQGQQNDQLVKLRDKIVNETKGGAMRGNASPTLNFRTTANAKSESQVKRGVKRKVSEEGSEGKRRKLDSKNNRDLKHVARATSFVYNSSSHVPKRSLQPSPPVHQDSVMKQPDRLPPKQGSKPASNKTPEIAGPVSSAIQAKKRPCEVTKCDQVDKKREGPEQQDRARMSGVGHYQHSGNSLNQPVACESNGAHRSAEPGASGKTQAESIHGLAAQSTDKSRVSEGAPSAVTTAKAAVSTAELRTTQPSSTPDGPAAREDAVARSSANQPSTKRVCVQKVKAPMLAEEFVISDETGAHRPTRKDQPLQKCPTSPPTNSEPTMLIELQQGIMMNSGMSASESQPSSTAPRSFARVRSRQPMGSVPNSGNARSTGQVTHDRHTGTASLPLEILMDSIAEANKKSLQSRIAPLSSRFENFFAENDKFLRSLQGQIGKATKTMESLREELAGVRKAVSDIPSIIEIKTFLKSHAQETRQAMTQEMQSFTSEVKEKLRDYLRRELESSMKDVAAQIQKDSVMLISKAIDNAISSGLLQDHPRIAGDNEEEDDFECEHEGPTQGEGNALHKNRNLVKYAGMDSDDIPLAFRFGPKTGKSLNSADEGGAERKLRPEEAGTANQNLMEKERAPVTPAVSQNNEILSNQSKRQFLPPSQTANPSHQEKSTLSDSRDKTVTALQMGSSTPEVNGTNVISTSSVVSREPTASSLPSNTLRASHENQIGHQMNQNVPARDERDQRDVKMAPQVHQARRENYEQLALQVRILLARCAVEWFLSGGCRDYAPPNERTTSVSVDWVNQSVLRCLDGIVKRLENEDTFEGAMKDLADSVGPGIETDWLLQGPIVCNINRARQNYTEWDPKLYDFEWESEKRVLANLSEKLIRSEQSLIEAGEVFEDLLYTATRYVRHASKSNAVQSTK